MSMRTAPSVKRALEKVINEIASWPKAKLEREIKKHKTGFWAKALLRAWRMK